MEEGTFEPTETTLILEKLSGTDVFVDVGSNIGFYACLARSRGVRTIAVEPHPFNLRRLYANLSENGWHDVEIFPVGLGASPRLAPLYGEGTGASLVEGWAGTSTVHRRLIPLLTLDLVFGKRFRDQRVFVKVDVEGLEKEVLLGATETLANLQRATWLVEICLTEHHPGGVNPVFSDVFDLFWSSGYRASALDQHQRAVAPADVQRWIAQRAQDFGSHNFLFARE